MLKNLIINWKWETADEKAAIPAFVPESDDTLDQEWEAYLSHNQNFIQKFDTVYRDELTESGTEGRIYRTKMDLNALLEKDAVALKTISDWLLTTFSPREGQLSLFLFHDKENFPPIYSPLKNQKYSQYACFGNVLGPIYGTDGLLGERSYEETVAEWDAEHQRFNIRGKPFERVWNSYWYQTKEKLELLLREIHTTRVPGFPRDKQDLVMRKARSLMNEYARLKDAPLPDWKPATTTEPLDWDFENSQDLLSCLGDFSEQKDWLDELIRFGQQEPYDFIPLERVLYQIIGI